MEGGWKGGRRRRRRVGKIMVSLYYVFYMRSLCRGERNDLEGKLKGSGTLSFSSCTFLMYVCMYRHVYRCALHVL